MQVRKNLKILTKLVSFLRVFEDCTLLKKAVRAKDEDQGSLQGTEEAPV